MIFPKEVYKAEQAKEYEGKPLSLIVQHEQELKKVPFEYVLFPKQVKFIEEVKKVRRVRKDAKDS